MRNQCTYFFSPPVPKMGSPCGVQALTIDHLPSKVQPPSFLHNHNGSKLRVLQQQEAHKWLGCMISATGSRNTHQHHLQAASRAFHADKWILCEKSVSVLHKLRYFEKVISPVACFGASHRAIHKDALAKLDVESRRLMRMVVGPPGVRSGLHASGEPVLGRRRKKHNMYTTAVYMRQKLTNEGKCEFHTTSSTSLHDPRFAYLQYA